MTFQLSKRDLN